MRTRKNWHFGAQRTLAVALPVALIALLAAALPGQAEGQAEVKATEVAWTAAVTLDPARWCKPVVHLGLVDDASPLTCWLHLTSEQPTVLPEDLLGMNFGDQPPWGDIDVEAIATELDRYEQQLETERADAERPTSNPRTPSPTGTATVSTEPKLDGLSDAELDHHCWTLQNPKACDLLWDRAASGGGSGGNSGSTAPPPVEDTQEYELYDYSQHHDEHAAWHEEMKQRAQSQVDAQCGGKGSATWYSDGTILVSCD